MTKIVVDRSSGGTEEESSTVVLEVTEGERFGVRLEAYHFCNLYTKEGTFTLTQTQ